MCSECFRETCNNPKSQRLQIQLKGRTLEPWNYKNMGTEVLLWCCKLFICFYHQIFLWSHEKKHPCLLLRQWLSFEGSAGICCHTRVSLWELSLLVCSAGLAGVHNNLSIWKLFAVKATKWISHGKFILCERLNYCLLLTHDHAPETGMLYWSKLFLCMAVKKSSKHHKVCFFFCPLSLWHHHKTSSNHHKVGLLAPAFLFGTTTRHCLVESLCSTCDVWLQSKNSGHECMHLNNFWTIIYYYYQNYNFFFIFWWYWHVYGLKLIFIFVAIVWYVMHAITHKNHMSIQLLKDEFFLFLLLMERIFKQ